MICTVYWPKDRQTDRETALDGLYVKWRTLSKLTQTVKFGSEIVTNMAL